MTTMDFIFSSVSSDDEFRVRLPVWSCSSNDFLMYLKDVMKLINNQTYNHIWRSQEQNHQIYQIEDEDRITQIIQMANKLELQIIPNFNIGIKTTKAS